MTLTQGAVPQWRDISTAPKGRVILLFGQIGYGRSEAHPTGPIRACGYWDEIDEAWAFTNTTWEGPFMAPTHWTDLPSPPEQP